MEKSEVGQPNFAKHHCRCKRRSGHFERLDVAQPHLVDESVSTTRRSASVALAAHFRQQIAG
jgi:hypothetical protein